MGPLGDGGAWGRLEGTSFSHDSHIVELLDHRESAIILAHQGSQIPSLGIARTLALLPCQALPHGKPLVLLSAP